MPFSCPVRTLSELKHRYSLVEDKESQRESKTGYDYLVPTPDMNENEMKDPMNAVTLKERRRINMKIDALEGEGEQNEEATELNEDANDYMVPTPDMIENEALATEESVDSPMNAVTITEQSRQDASIELQLISVISFFFAEVFAKKVRDNFAAVCKKSEMRGVG